MVNDGIIILNKPSGITSFDAVAIIKHKLRPKKIGHAGTLDPLATGVLVVLIGKATKKFDKFSNFGKEYEATLTFGSFTTTGDKSGEIIKSLPFGDFKKEDIQRAFDRLVGERTQIPPMVSAIKYKGKRLYNLARRGIEIKREPRKINIEKLGLLNYAAPNLDFYVKCSKGTYVRRLAEEVAEGLGTAAFISRITRISVGPFKLKNSLEIDEVDESSIQVF